MRKVLLTLLLLFVAGALVACGGTEVEQKEVEKVESGANEEPKTEKPAEEPKEEAENEVKAINQLIVDNENIKATLIDVKKKSDDIMGNSYEVKFEVENKTDQSLEVQARSVSADGKMIDETILSMSQEIAAGKKADAILTISEFEGYEFPPLENNLEMGLYVFSWDNMDFEEEHPVKIEFK